MAGRGRCGGDAGGCPRQGGGSGLRPPPFASWELGVGWARLARPLCSGRSPGPGSLGAGACPRAQGSAAVDLRGFAPLAGGAGGRSPWRGVGGAMAMQGAALGGGRLCADDRL